jgi:hypothetical protein
MYDVKPNLILGFHGCDRQVRDRFLLNPNEYQISQEPFDWLGHGLYFWENNYERAFQWAEEKKKKGRIQEPSVIGAVLFLGHCCDLLEQKYIRLLTSYHAICRETYKDLNKQLPQNKDLHTDPFNNKLLRYLDCTIIEFMYAELSAQIKSDVAEKGHTTYKIFDSTRGAFIEGGPAFEGAGIHEKTHLQICIRNPNCIKGFFLPRKEIDFAPWKENTTIMSPAA